MKLSVKLKYLLVQQAFSKQSQTNTFQKHISKQIHSIKIKYL